MRPARVDHHQRTTMGIALYFIGAIVAFVCFVIVLIKMFQVEKDQIWLPIIAIFCGIIAFIWGWAKGGPGLKKVMLAWSAGIVLMLIGGVLGGFSYRLNSTYGEDAGLREAPASR